MQKAIAAVGPTDVVVSGPLHLLKMAVGISDLDELRAVRAARLAERGGNWVYTRNWPRRVEAVLAGGSIYWVIRGQVLVRQRITGFQPGRNDEGRACCLIEVDPELVPTVPRPWRPFQGWRYLSPADAPRDAADYRSGSRSGNSEMPTEMLAELRSLGLL
jgi:hypothetical protein